MVFVKNTEPAAPGRPKSAALRGTSSAWACVFLAVLGLGGGLAMAFFSFNSSEAAPRIAGVPREIIYVPPPGPSSLVGDSATPLADATGVPPSATGLASVSFDTLKAFETADDLVAAETFVVGSANGLSNVDTSSAASFAATNATDLAHTMGSFVNTNAAASEAALSGVLLPVPEPSTWATLLSGAGVMLIAALRRRTDGSRSGTAGRLAS
jgi:hypothetical protein